MRRDARYCRTGCRQAAHRFGRGLRLRPPAADPLRLAYADPPYLGKAHLYDGHPDGAGEVDHDELFRRLDPYDGWALSCSAQSLPTLLRLPSCPAEARVAVWVRGARANSRARRPLNAYEAVIYHGGRALDPSLVDGERLDVLEAGVTPRTTDPDRVIGAKPATFCWWLIDLLGAMPGDTLDDLFPGSGAISRAWALYTSHDTTATRPDVERDPSPPAAATSRPGAHDVSPGPRATRPPATRDDYVAAAWNRPLPIPT